MKKQDLQYFLVFPFNSIVYILNGVILYLISVSTLFSYLTNPRNFEDVFKSVKALETFKTTMFVLELVIKYSLIAAGTILVIIGVLKILFFFVRRKSSEEYAKNYSEILQNYQKRIQEQTGTSNISLFDSFRPWMYDEYCVKKVYGDVKMFFPRYLVAFAINKQQNSLNIVEAEINVSSKTWKLIGNWELKLNSLVGVGFTCERITFYNVKEENNLEFAKVHFLELHSYGSLIKIPLFESELLSKYENIDKLEKEFIDKARILLQMLRSEKLNQA